MKLHKSNQFRYIKRMGIKQQKLINVLCCFIPLSLVQVQICRRTEGCAKQRLRCACQRYTVQPNGTVGLFTILLTSHKPMRILKATSKATPALAATGVRSVKTAVDRIPRPNKFLPPNLRARQPPGIWVII